MTTLTPGMSLDALQALQKEVAAQIATEQDTLRAKAKEHLEAEAKKLGFTIPDLFGIRSKTKGKRVAAKWAHPENDQLTWSGRGKKPSWLVELLAKGGKAKPL